MRKIEYLVMLIQDNETESEPKKELHEAVIECTVEALSQTPDDKEVEQFTLEELFKLIEASAKDNKSNCVSPFKAAELIAEKFGCKYERPINKLKAKICAGALDGSRPPKHSLEDFL